jgi:Spy/CpxP family protein refolding chaperone
MNGKGVMAAAVLLAAAGCKPAQGPSEPPAAQQGAGVIDTMTQKSKIEAGKRTAAKVREIGEEQQRDLEQVMGE